MSEQTLTNLEHEIMDILWNSDEPLTVAEISERTNSQKLSIASVNQVIPRLIQKEFIEIKTFKAVSKKYARAFSPLVTLESYATQQLTTYFNSDSSKSMLIGLKSLISNLVNNQNDKEESERLLRDLRDYAEEKLNQL